MKIEEKILWILCHVESFQTSAFYGPFRKGVHGHATISTQHACSNSTLRPHVCVSFGVWGMHIVHVTPHASSPCCRHSKHTACNFQAEFMYSTMDFSNIGYWIKLTTLFYHVYIVNVCSFHQHHIWPFSANHDDFCKMWWSITGLPAGSIYRTMVQYIEPGLFCTVI